MNLFIYILLAILFVCAIAVTISKNLLNSVLIFMAFSLVMSIIWILLESPDLAITEAAVGAGVTTVLFLATLKKIRAIDDETEEDLSGVDFRSSDFENDYSGEDGAESNFKNNTGTENVSNQIKEAKQ